MFAIKSIKASLISRKHHTLFPPSGPPNSKNFILCLCKNNDSNPNDSDPESPSPEGDTLQQELLATIAMLQTHKVRLTEYLDERAAYLTQYAEEANSEFDRVGEDAFRDIQEAGDTIMENIKSKMQAFRESQELNRVDIEKNENKLEWFEDQIEENRNEGLFLKNLGARKSLDKAEAREEMEEIKEVIKETAGSKSRRNIYLALMALLVVEIADSFISSPDWRKVAVLGAILVALFTQFGNEQAMISEAEKLEKERSDQKK